ncbi:1-acyl-sn-glycerol-3-phosphate acyltransferase [Fulvivirgaceae bacterium BMA10]|uniref:1-acyl-sn-glycerol-3-phosphate acyltransferase n=1 Tax=Splendidivirga corallicola TaxID=3051826 RepID=A0ABT8KTV4_9BACT|nr:1-acyl-sn-glycerol-3-phosphate acyltransferase [Fulvivirgaceae bacterium BMA10]
MMKFLSLLIFKLKGWKVVGAFPMDVKKAVMIAAPHTSNWDFLYARCAFYIMGVPLKYTIKKELMKFPLNILLKAMGAIPIDRKPKQGLKSGKTSMVDVMVDLFKERDQLVVLVTPEGTRSYAKRWKTGFYHVANGAGVPMVFGYLDYKKKVAGVGRIMEATGDLDKDMEEIKDFYRGITAKYPENGIK